MLDLRVDLGTRHLPGGQAPAGRQVGAVVQFVHPGMGRLAVNAIFQRDYPVVTGAAVLTTTMVVLGNLIADVLYAVVDPRIRYS